MKRLRLITFGAILSFVMSGCATGSDGPQTINPSLPTINTLRTISDMNEIGFEWTAIDDANVVGFYLYRADADGANERLIADIDDRFATHYVDADLPPQTMYRYKIKSYNQNGVSPDGTTVSASTSGLIDSVPFARAIYGLPDRIKLIWRPHPDERVKAYIIQRHTIGGSSWDQIAKLRGRLNAEYIDHKIARGRQYEYRILVQTYNGLISKPSGVIPAEQ